MTQLIKSAITYKAIIPVDADTIERHLRERLFTEPEPHVTFAAGFVRPRPLQNDLLISEFTGGFAFRVRIDTKTVPASLLKKKLKEQSDKIFQEQGRKVGKKEKAELREAIGHELAIQAFPKTTELTCFYHIETQFLFVPTTNQKHADVIVSELIHAVESVKTETVNVSNMKHGLTKRLHGWINDYAEDMQSDAFGNFHPCEMVSMFEDKRKVTIDMHDFLGAQQAITEALSSGFQVSSIGLMYSGNDNDTTFRLTQDFRLRAIDIPHCEFDPETDLFVSQATIEVASLSEVMTALVEMLSYENQQNDASDADEDKPGSEE